MKYKFTLLSSSVEMILNIVLIYNKTMYRDNEYILDVILMLTFHLIIHNILMYQMQIRSFYYKSLGWLSFKVALKFEQSK
jgi:hypothetical protein